MAALNSYDMRGKLFHRYSVIGENQWEWCWKTSFFYIQYIISILISSLNYQSGSIKLSLTACSPFCRYKYLNIFKRERVCYCYSIEKQYIHKLRIWFVVTTMINKVYIFCIVLYICVNYVDLLIVRDVNCENRHWLNDINATTDTIFMYYRMLFSSLATRFAMASLYMKPNHPYTLYVSSYIGGTSRRCEWLYV